MQDEGARYSIRVNELRLDECKMAKSGIASDWCLGIDIELQLTVSVELTNEGSSCLFTIHIASGKSNG